MSENIYQVYTANPITSNTSTDLMYFGLSPYGATNDAAMTYANFAAQFASSALTTNYIYIGVGGVATASQTLPTAVQGNITQLGAQSQALNMNSNLINNVSTPLSANDAVNKQYADNIAAGLNPVDGVQAATTANLNATYSNGVSGVGATLTNAGAQAAFAVDGYSANPNDRILVKNQTSNVQNGIYTVTIVGTGATNWVLTRATDYNTPSQIQTGDLIAVSNGSTQLGSSWIQTATVVTIGTSPITFSPFFLPSNFISSILTNGTIYIGNGSNIATQSSTTWPATSTANQLLYSSATNTIGGLTSGNNGVLVTSNTGVPSINTSLAQGLVVASSVLTVGAANNIPFNTTKGIQDNNGNSQLLFTVTASAVNYINITNNSTGNKPIITGTGSDSNVLLSLQNKGNSGVEIQGTTAAGNATAGYVGEFISSVITQASPVSISTGVPKSITSIALTAGDWDVWGNVGANTSASMQGLAGALNTANNTLPNPELYTYLNLGTGAIGTESSIPIPMLRANISSTTTYYLIINVAGTGTLTGYGGIYARRRR